MLIKIKDLEETYGDTVATRDSLRQEAYSHALHSKVPN
jgi:hypothetical protein